LQATNFYPIKVLAKDSQTTAETKLNRKAIKNKRASGMVPKAQNNVAILDLEEQVFLG
jgi:hypothetical protein